MANLKSNGTEVVRLEKASERSGLEGSTRSVTTISIRSNGWVLRKTKTVRRNAAGHFTTDDGHWTRMNQLKITGKTILPADVPTRDYVSVGYKVIRTAAKFAMLGAA